MTNTNPISLALLLPKYMEPVPFLGCIGGTKEEGEKEFFKLGYKYLKSSTDLDIYSACFITEEGVDYYSEYDELPIYMCTSYKYDKLTKEVKRSIRAKIKATLFSVINKLKANGIEVCWRPTDKNVFYISDQTDLENVTICQDSPTLQEEYISTIYDAAKSLGVNPEITSKYIDLVEILLSGGMYPWELTEENETVIAKMYNKDKLLLLSVKQLDELIDKVRNGQHRLK
jgi:hypothetical protein